MRTIQQRIIQTFQVKPTVNSNFEIRERVNFLKSYLRSASAQGFVLGISGGQDSSLAGRLCQLAARELREEGTEARFTAVRLPYRKQRDEEDAQQALRFIQPDDAVTVDVSSGTDGITKECEKLLPEPVTDFNKGNLKARVRMAVQYLIAGHGNYLVVGTDHAAEAVTGFFTKFGDGAADLVPLAGLNKRQGRELLRTLGSPPILWEKKPTADLLDSRPGLLDETELGLSYDDIDDFLEGKDVPTDIAEAIESRFLATQHKRSLPVAPYNDWWQKTA